MEEFYSFPLRCIILISATMTSFEHKLAVSQWKLECRIGNTEFTIPSVTSSHSGPEGEQHPHTNTLPPPCFTISMIFLIWDAVLALYQMKQVTMSGKCSILDSSICRMLYQKLWGSSRYVFCQCEMILYVFLLS